MRSLVLLTKLLVALALAAWIGCIGLTMWLDHQLRDLDATLDRCNRDLRECRATLDLATARRKAAFDRIDADLKAINDCLEGDLPARP